MSTEEEKDVRSKKRRAVLNGRHRHFSVSSTKRKYVRKWQSITVCGVVRTFRANPGRLKNSLANGPVKISRTSYYEYLDDRRIWMVSFTAHYCLYMRAL